MSASNTWSYFQAKRARRAQTELTRDLASLHSPKPQALLDRYSEEIERYKKEADEITAQAKAYEKAAEAAEHRGDYFDFAEVLFQISLVFCSITLLTKKKGFYFGGTTLGIIAASLASYAYIVFR